MAALSHPSILAIHDFGRDGGTAYAVMELLDGETLRQRLAGGALPVRKRVEYAVQMAQALAAAHDKGIVHRDLKPENVFVTREGRLKVLDFGLTKRDVPAGDGSETSSPTAPRPTEPGAVLGTVGYTRGLKAAQIPVESRMLSIADSFDALVAPDRPNKRIVSPERGLSLLRDEARLGRFDPALVSLFVEGNAVV